MKLYTPNTGTYNFIMAYPATENFALSSIGYLWLYMLADKMQGINAKQIFTDNFNTNIDNIDSLAFSMSYDFDFMGVFKILEHLKIPFEVDERDENSPLIFAGGPVITTNPKPYEKIFDFMILGDGEETFIKVLECLKEKLPKKETLIKLQTIDGVYVPGNVCKRAIAQLCNVIHTPIISEKGYFKDTFIIEISRGCMNKCAFCTASYTNLPYRYYPYEKIIQTIDFGLKHANKIALLGAQITLHPQFKDIMEYIRNLIKNGKKIELGISSLRTDSITPELIQTLVLGGQKHSTIAIEAASERLRKFINKNLSEEQILNAIKISRENGLKGLKIYSMIGIPNETQDDIEEFIRLAKLIKNSNKGFNIEFSFSTFVPKPQTPFQWTRRENTKSLTQKRNYLEKNLAKLGISSKFSSEKWDYWQTIISRGDENITELLISVYQNGGNLSAYKNAIKKFNINTEKYTNNYNKEDNLPWENFINKHEKETLWNEYQKLLKKYETNNLLYQQI